MALIEQGILGPFSGKCGTVIGYIRNGQFCMRSMPTHYRDRRSQAQLKNRNRFSMVMKTMSIVRPVITLGFSRFATDMTEMNVATKVNYRTLVQEDDSGLNYHFSELLLSRGPVEPLSNVMTTLVDTSLTLFWDSRNLASGGADKISVVLINADRMAMKFHRALTRRDAGSLSLTLPASWKGNQICLYTMVERGEDWSDSVFVGELSAQTKALPSKPAGSKTVNPQDGPQTLSHQTAVKLLFPSGQVRDNIAPDKGYGPPS